MLSVDKSRLEEGMEGKNIFQFTFGLEYFASDRQTLLTGPWITPYIDV